MKAAVTFFALVACVVAVPVQQERSLSPFDWSKITPLDIFVDPIDTAPAVSDDVGGRIIGGGVIARNSVPWQGYIIINGGSFCGCSVISNTWFLTAAHCTVSARTVQIVLGAHNRNQNEATQVVLSASSLINHPSYNTGTQFSNDIALLRITGQITLTAAIQPVNLAPANAGNYAGSTAFLSGWGVANSGSQPAELHGVSLAVLTNAVCQQYFGSTILASNICTNGVRNNAVVGACNGDSGGPLTVNNVQVGVVSFGASGCVAGYPSAFTRVSSYRNWITQNTGI